MYTSKRVIGTSENTREAQRKQWVGALHKCISLSASPSTSLSTSTLASQLVNHLKWIKAQFLVYSLQNGVQKRNSVQFQGYPGWKRPQWKREDNLSHLTHWLLELFAKNTFFGHFGDFQPRYHIMGQISSNLFKKAFAKWHHAFLSTDITTFLLGHAQKSKFWVLGWESDLCL